MTWISIYYGIDQTYFFVSDSNKIFAVLVSVSMFLFFKNLKIKQSKTINTIATSTFGVLCVHANSDLMRQWLWKDTLNNVAAYRMGVYGIEHYLISVAAVVAVCTLIDMARIRWVEKPFMKRVRSIKWLQGWDQFSDAFYYVKR